MTWAYGDVPLIILTHFSGLPRLQQFGYIFQPFLQQNHCWVLGCGCDFRSIRILIVTKSKFVLPWSNAPRKCTTSEWVFKKSEWKLLNKLPNRKGNMDIRNQFLYPGYFYAALIPSPGSGYHADCYLNFWKAAFKKHLVNINSSKLLKRLRWHD